MLTLTPPLGDHSIFVGESAIQNDHYVNAQPLSVLLKSSSSFDLPVRPGRMDMVWSGRVAKMWSGRVVMV